MRQINYVPQLVNEQGELVFTGILGINMPKYPERMALLRDANFQVKNGELASGQDQMTSIIKLIEIAEKHIVVVDVVRKDDGMVFRSLDDLSYDREGSLLINEVGNVILSGVKLGKQ